MTHPKELTRKLLGVGIAGAVLAAGFVAPSGNARFDVGSAHPSAALAPLLGIGTAGARVGGAPPPFTLPAAVGGPSTGQFRMSEHLRAHHPVVILFWATWCVPCRQELPFYQTLYERFHAQGLEVVAISMDAASTITRVGPQARRLGITYNVVTDLDTRVTSEMNPRRSAPFSVWVNREGRITWEREGFSPAEQDVVGHGVEELMAP